MVRVMHDFDKHRRKEDI